MLEGLETESATSNRLETIEVRAYSHGESSRRFLSPYRLRVETSSATRVNILAARARAQGNTKQSTREATCLRLNVSRFSCRAGRPIDNNHRAHSSVTDGITQVAGALIKAEFPAKYSNWRVHALPGNLICFPFDGGPQIDPDDIAIRVLSSRGCLGSERRCKAI